MGLVVSFVGKGLFGGAYRVRVLPPVDGAKVSHGRYPERQASNLRLPDGARGTRKWQVSVGNEPPANACCNVTWESLHREAASALRRALPVHPWHTRCPQVSSSQPQTNFLKRNKMSRSHLSLPLSTLYNSFPLFGWGIRAFQKGMANFLSLE